METSSFLIWVLFIGTIATISLGAMIWAYLGRGSLAVVFTEPIVLLPELLSKLDADAATHLEQGCDALRQGDYRQASDWLSDAIRQNPQLAEAYHNRGRATANLRQDNEAAALLVRAGELYLQQDNPAGYEQIKQDLQQLQRDRSKRQSTKD